VPVRDKDFLMFFNPSYEPVLISEKKIKAKYQDYIGSCSLFSFVNALKEINNSYLYGWNGSTKKI